MATEVKLWQVKADRTAAVEPGKLDLEDRLEDWLCKDIDLLSEDLLVIGRQIQKHGGTLDLLAVDREGNLVVIELKRGRTPREVVAQALDYASWVKWFNREDVEEHTRNFLGKAFDEAFRSAFDEEPPEEVNQRQRMYIVASSLDASTQRIVEYLSGAYGVDINAATFSYFNVSEGEVVARSMLRDDEEDVTRRPGRTSRRLATKRLSSRVEEGQLVVEFPEEDLAKRWELPDPSDSEAIGRTRKEAFAFVREHGASKGQVNAVSKALTDNGYRVRG